MPYQNRPCANGFATTATALQRDIKGRGCCRSSPSAIRSSMIGNREDLDPQDKRVRCDNLKWLMSKLLPKRYADRLLVAGDAENPLQVLHQQVSLVDLTNDQLDALDKFTRSLSDVKQQ